MANVQLNYEPNMLGTIQSIFDVRRQTCFAEMKTCAPAIVYDISERDSGIVSVIPLIKKSYADGGTEEREVVKTTLVTSQHGGFYVHSPVFIGDTGWLISSDGDTGKVKPANSAILEANVKPGAVDSNNKLIANAGPQSPDLPRVHHTFTHGFFIPDKWGGVPIPDDMKDSFVIEQVNAGDKNSNSKGRFILDPDGTIRILSTRWYDGNETDLLKRLKSGTVFVDLTWYGKSSPLEKSPTWKLGDFKVDANSLLQGDVHIVAWKDKTGVKHGGNLAVDGYGHFGGKLEVGGETTAHGSVSVEGSSRFSKKMVVKEDSKAVIIDPKLDLHKTDAKFREVTVVTGLNHDKNSSNKVGLNLQRMRVLVDQPENRDPIEFDVGGDGGSPSTTPIHVITGVSLEEVEEEETKKTYLALKLTSVDCVVYSWSTHTDEYVQILSKPQKQAVVTKSEYSTTTHVFTNKYKNVYVIDPESEDSEQEVFTAVPHQTDI